MWSAIIQAIDHAMERTQKGMSAGIDVANSQHGGSVGSGSQEQVDTSKTGEEIKNASSTPQNEALSKLGGSGATEGAGAASGAGAGEAASDAAGAASTAGAAEGAAAILSDAKAKTATSAGSSVSTAAKTKDTSKASAAAKNTVSGWQKARSYGSNAAKGFANAGAIATGQGKAFDYDDNWLSEGVKPNIQSKGDTGAQKSAQPTSKLAEKK